jgi:hypothetical protein
MSIRFDLTDAVAKKKLANLPKNMLDWSEEVLLKQAELMKGIWQVSAAVDTGAYRDSIRIERGGIGQNWRQVRVRAGGYVINPKTGRLVDYAGHLERRYHFGEAAFQQVRYQIVEMIKTQVVEKANE